MPNEPTETPPLLSMANLEMTVIAHLLEVVPCLECRADTTIKKGASRSSCGFCTTQREAVGQLRAQAAALRTAEQERDALRQRDEYRRSNAGTCAICGTTIWGRDGLIQDERVMHPLCQLRQRAEVAEREAAALREAIPPCHICGKPASCFGSYEGNDVPYDFACDDCCGHGCEDGNCVPIKEIPAFWAHCEVSDEKAEAELVALREERDEWVKHFRTPIMREVQFTPAEQRALFDKAWAAQADAVTAAREERDALRSELAYVRKISTVAELKVVAQDNELADMRQRMARQALTIHERQQSWQTMREERELYRASAMTAYRQLTALRQREQELDADNRLCGRCGHVALHHASVGRGECQVPTGCACDCFEFVAYLAPPTGETQEPK